MGMHPTRDTPAVIFSEGLGGRVMPGVRLLLRFGITTVEYAAAADGTAA